ncbi:MAG: alanine racemase [Eubacteriales bacterium]
MYTDVKKTRAYVDLEAIAGNYRHAAAQTGVPVIAVVKANAYGHGAAAVARRLMDEGCRFFAVATVDEALELRESGVTGRILVLGYVLDDCLEQAVAKDISLAIDSACHLQKLLDVAAGRAVNVHIKLDTGMNRTGFAVKDSALPSGLAEAAELLLSHPNAVCEGVFSHFAVADEDDGGAFTALQFERYRKAVAALEKMGVKPAVRHICNSAGLVRFADMRLDAVRMGITLYGCGNLDPACRPAMSFKTVIVNVHTLKAGESVSYGLTYTAERDRRIAVIGAGYADGLKRCLSGGKGCVLCHGKRAPFVGRICMDMAMIDVTDIPEAAVGDDVTIFGQDGNAVLTADEVAKNAGTISYEILCSVSGRVPRVYE